MMKSVFFGAVLLMTFVNVGCGSSESRTQNPVTPSYTLNNNGTCFGSNGQIVNSTYCANQQQTGNPYTQNTYQTGYNNNTNTNYGGYFPSSPQGTQCNGIYYYYNGYQLQPVQCYANICSGYTMYNQNMMPVVCQ